MSELLGADELRARLAALKRLPKEASKGWAEDAADYAKRHVPARTVYVGQTEIPAGSLRHSIHIVGGSERGAKVLGAYWANFIDKGTKEHTITPKKSRRATKKRAARVAKPFLVFNTPQNRPGGSRVFARKVTKRATPGNNFKAEAVEYGLERNISAAKLVVLWNEAKP